MNRKPYAKRSLDDRKKQLDRALKSNQPRPGRYAAGHNLYLNVSTTGAKSWVFIWKPQGRKQRELGLGSYTGAGSVTFLNPTQARAAAEAVRAMLQANPEFDPIAARQQAKFGALTFGDLMTKVIANESPTWKDSNRRKQTDEWERTRDQHCKLLKNRAVATITAIDVLAVVEPMWTETNQTARRVRNRIEKVMSVAISRDLHKGPNPARYENHLENLLPKVVVEAEHHEMLPYADLPAFWVKLTAPSNKGIAAKALAFTILTAVRTANTIGMRWSEIDWERNVWTIPASRMKVEKRGEVAIAHEVPLSSAALATLESVRGLDADIVFPGGRGGTMAAGTMNEKLCKPKAKGGMEYAGIATVHGFRATFSTWVNEETSFSAEEREFALAHVQRSVVEAYQRGTSVEKRRPMMQAWADHCEGKTGENVLPFKKEAA